LGGDEIPELAEGDWEKVYLKCGNLNLALGPLVRQPEPFRRTAQEGACGNLRH
jgi:hypothetical protein